MKEINKYQVADDKLKSDKTEIELKLLGYFFLFLVIGAVACLVIGILKAAIDTIMIVGCVLGIIALAVLFLYERAKWRIHLTRYHHDQKF